MTVDFNAYYVHRKKGFTVVVSEPAWWDGQRDLSRLKPPLVLVMRCGLAEGRMKWLMNEQSFERTYRKEA